MSEGKTIQRTQPRLFWRQLYYGKVTREEVHEAVRDDE